MTIASLIFDPKNDALHIAAGPPTQSEYQLVGLPDVAAPKAAAAG